MNYSHEFVRPKEYQMPNMYHLLIFTSPEVVIRLAYEETIYNAKE
jgi:hypothetical protein